MHFLLRCSPSPVYSSNRQLAEVTAFGKILAEQTISIFIRAAQARRIRVGKIDLATALVRDALMAGKLLAVVQRQRMHHMPIEL